VGVYSGPEIINDGLVLALDAANSKGFDDDENLALNSEAINSWGSNGNSISISANSQIAPDGTLTADVLSQTAVTGASRWTSSMTRTYTAGVTYTLSIWLKKISGTDAQPGINLWVEGGTSQSVGTITTEWVRYSKSFTPASTISSNTFTGLNIGWNDTGVANNFTFSAWGFQVETGSSASPYYLTTGTAKTRGTTLIDMTGRGNSGTLTNGPTYNSSNGGSLVLDGVDDYALGTINGSIFTGSFTQSAWIYKLNANQIWQGVFTNSSPATNYTYLMTFGNGSVAAPYNSVGANQVGISDSGIFLDIGTHTNRWLYIVMTKTGSTLNIYCYKDGTLLQTSGTINWNGGNFATTNNYEIGRHWAGGSIVPLQGNIAQVQVYNRALTAAEVQQNYNATKSRYGL